MAGPRPVVEGVFTPSGADGTPHLLASRCTCGARAFPPRVRCAACGTTDLRVEEAAAAGVVSTWTTMPGTNPPRVVARVRLDDGLVAQGYVLASADAVAIDARVTTVTVPGDGDDTVGYAFQPVEEVPT